MLRLQSLKEHTYKLKADDGVSFTLVPLTSADRLDLMYESDTAKRYGQTMLRACELCIRDWSGVQDEAGAAVPFSKDAIKRLDINTLVEVAGHVLKISELSPEEKKA